MAEYTVNYNLEKQQENEYVNIHGINNNFNIIDEKLKDAEEKADQAFQSASNGKVVIKNAITGADTNVIIPTEPTFQQLADAIGRIKTGVDTSDATATAEQILAGITAYVKEQKVTGTMRSYENGEILRFYDNIEEIIPHPQDTESQARIKVNLPQKGYINNTQFYMNILNVLPKNIKHGVKVGHISDPNKQMVGAFTGDATAEPENVLMGKVFYGQGNKKNGTMSNISATTGAKAHHSMRNLAINHGLDNNGQYWNLYNAVIVSDGGYQGSGAKLNPGSGSHALIGQTVNLVAGRKYYASVMVKKTTSGLSGELDVSAISPELDFAAISDTAVPNINTWTLVSNIATSQVSAQGQFRVYTGNKSDVYLDNLTLIDLTATFGAGKEPTKLQMDKLLIHFGYGLSSSVVAGLYNGAYVTNSGAGYPLVGYRDDNLIPDNIKSGTTVLGQVGTFTDDANAISASITVGASAYVKGVKVNGTLPPMVGDTYYHYPAAALEVGKFSGDGNNYAYMGVPNGHYLHNVSWIKSYQPYLTPENIVIGANIFGVAGTAQYLKYASGNATTSVINGSGAMYFSNGSTSGSIYRANISGLTFTPKLVKIVFKYGGPEKILYGTLGENSPFITWVDNVTSGSLITCGLSFGNYPANIIVGGSFSIIMPPYIVNSLTWEAWG